MLVPSADSTKWIRRFVELRRPYLHVHAVGGANNGEEVNIVGLRNARIESSPGIARLLKGGSSNNANDNSRDSNPSANSRSGQDQGQRNSWTVGIGGIYGGRGRSGSGASLLGYGGRANGAVDKGKEIEESVFAVYGTDNTWLFRARSEREKVEWIWRIDRGWFDGGGGRGNNDRSEGEARGDERRGREEREGNGGNGEREESVYREDYLED